MTPGKFSAPVEVSTLTVLQPYTDLLNQALIAVVNLDATETVTVILSMCEDGVHSDESSEVQIPPGCQRSFRVNAFPLDRYFKLEAHTDGQPALVKWVVRYS